MGTIQLIAAVIVIALIAVVAYVRHRKETYLQDMLSEVEKIDEKLEPKDKRGIKLPSGRRMPPDEDLFNFTEADIQDYVPADQFVMLTYFSKRYFAERDENTKSQWERLYHITYGELSPLG